MNKDRDLTSAGSRPARKRKGCLWWLGRVVVGSIALVVLLNLAGFVYETIASKGDMERYPPPGELVDVGGIILCLRGGTAIPIYPLSITQ